MTLIACRPLYESEDRTALIGTPVEGKVHERNHGEKTVSCQDYMELSRVLDDDNVRMRTVGKRKNGQERSGKQKKGDSGERYDRNNEDHRRRRTSQGNGSSGMEGSGEGSGNGDESSDDEEDDCDGEDEDEDDEEEEEEDEMEEEIEEDTDNVSTIVDDDMDESTNGLLEKSSLELKQLEFDNPGPKVASAPGDLQSNGSEEVKDETVNGGNTMDEMVTPAPSGTPITLSGVIWKETVGGVLVVNLKYRNKTYCGSLIDNSRHGWATPRNVDEPTEHNMSNSKRGKGRKGRHNGSNYTGNPLSPKMTGNGKRGPRYHRNKGKHGKDSFVRPRSKRGVGSDNAEEGTRTRRRSCTVKTTISPSPSPTPLIECPERNCNKKYKHINGLRYHQAHAHLDNIADPDDKDSDEDEETKSNGIKEPLSKSSSSDDVKPLSRRKGRTPKTTSSTKSGENGSAEDSLETDPKTEDAKEDGEKENMTNIKVEPDKQDEPVKQPEDKPESSSANILQEAVKMIFDEPNVPDSQITCANDVPHPGIFARMISQHMMVGSHNEDYKYVPYETMAEPLSAPTEKTGTSLGVTDMDITVKEEVIEEGNVDQTEDDLKLVNTETNFEVAKSQEDITTNVPPENDKTKLIAEKQCKSSHGNRKIGVTDTVAKTSAAEIRSLPGYQHFRLSSNSPGGFITQSTDDKKSLNYDARLFEAKDPEKSISGMIWDSGGTPKQQGTFDKQKSKLWKLPSTSSFQLTCESKNSLMRSGYSGVSSSKKARSVVTASTTWVPEVHPAVMQKTSGTQVSGQEVVPEKPLGTRDVIDRARTGEQEEEKSKIELGKSDEERSKASSFPGKPARAVGVAHPFNTEKSEDEFPLGSIGSFSSEPVKVLYSKSSSPKVSLDLNHPEMTEVKKVRVEKTLEVPVGEVTPLAKNNRSAVVSSDAREALIMGGEGTEAYSAIRASLSDNRPSQPIDNDSTPRDITGHPSYIPAVSERPIPWQPAYSPPMEPRVSRDPSQYTSRETSRSPLRKTGRRSPSVRELDRSPALRPPPGGFAPIDTGRRTPEEDTAKRLFQRIPDTRLPFSNFEERPSPHKGLPLRDVGRSSPEKDSPGRVPPRGSVETLPYRDSDRLSPGGEKTSASQFREYDRSPVGDSSQGGRRSPPVRNRLQRSPEREIIARASYRTSPSPSNRETIVHSPYRDKGRVVKQPRDNEETIPRRSGESEVRSSDPMRGYSSKSTARTTKETTEGTNIPRAPSENKFSRLSDEEAMMLKLRTRFLPYPGTPQDSAAREAMENYMMYFGRLPIPHTIDPRLLQAYSMLPAAQLPLLIPPPKENTITKEDRPKEGSDETRSKSSSSKSETSRSRGVPFSESADLEIVTSKRPINSIATSGSKEKTEHESLPSKRTKPSEPKDVHEIVDEREGNIRKLEERFCHQALQHKVDAFNQLQSEKNLKQKAEEKSNNRLKSSNSSSSRQKLSIDYRTSSKKEESLFSGSRSYEKDKSTSKEDKARLSPTTRPATSESNGQSWSRNSENKSPQSGVFPGFVSGPHLPANHGLSNSYEQATLAMQGMPPFLMPPYHHLPGIMMANPLVAGAQFHNAVAARSHETTKRDHSRSSSTTTDQSRTKDDEQDSTPQTKKDVKTNPSSSPSKVEIEKDRGRERPRKTNENEEDKQRTLRDNPTSLHGSQNLPSNLAFGRGNMSAIDQSHFNQAFPRMIYPPSGQGNYRPSFEHLYSPYSRK